MSNIGIPSSSTIGIFEGKSIITSVSFGSKCTYIGDNAFKNCVSLKQINDDNMIEYIGNNAFQSCVSLKQSNNDSSVDNNSTEKIHILNFNNLTSLGESAFEYCESLENVSMNKCSTVSPYAFKDCKSLSHINIPNCTEIGSLAFMSCKALKNVTLNSNATNTKILSCAFYGCENLSDIYLDNCAKIDFGAFEKCLSLSKITLNNCGEIGSRAFHGCKNLSEVHINTPHSSDGRPYCKLVNIDAFENTNDNIMFYIAAEIIDTYKYDSNWSTYVNKMKPFNKDTQIIYVTTDNKIGFKNTEGSDSNNDIDGITSYKISYNGSFGIVEFDNVLLSLNDKLFKGLTTLSRIELPDKCERIGEREFSGCENLSYVELPNVKYIGNYAFENCISLTEFTIPDSVEELGDGVFAGCKNISFKGKFATADGNAAIFEYDELTPDSERYNKKYKLISVSPKDNRRKLDIFEIYPKISILGKSCFYGCENLRRVDIHTGEDNITNIGDYAFDGCENLYEVHFYGNDMFTIGKNIFGDTPNKDLKIFVPEAGLNAFLTKFENTGYKDRIYPRPENNSIICFTVDNISPDLSNLPMVKIDNKNGYIYYKTPTSVVTNIQQNWFTDKQNITKVILGENINSLGYGAFQNCTKLEYIYIPDTLREIGTYCFNNCTSLTSISVPKGGSNRCIFGSYVFDGCSSIKEFKSYHKECVSDDNRCCIDDDNYIVYFAPSGYDSEYTVPDNIKGIYANAFKKSQITSISLPNVTTIGASAFSECEYLEKIQNWDNVKTISASAFENCENLGKNYKISLPNNLTTIGISAFSGCKLMNLEKSIPNSVTVIGSSAFKNCESLNITDSELTLGKITSIDSYTFANCKSLEKVKIPNSVTLIGGYAFSESGVTSVSLSENSNLNIISTGAFYNCNSLKHLPLTRYLTQIGREAFYNCKNYAGFNINDFDTSINSSNLEKKLSLPINLSSIGENAFANTGIYNVSIPNNKNLTSIPNGAFLNCVSLKTITISSTSLKRIEKNAFSGCTNLCTNNGTLNLPNSISYIGDCAFKDCPQITTLTLPSSLTFLGNECFYKDPLKASKTLKVTIPTGLSKPPSFPTVNSTPFNETNLLIYIPIENMTAYQNSFYWSKYKNMFREIITSADSKPGYNG